MALGTKATWKYRLSGVVNIVYDEGRVTTHREMQLKEYAGRLNKPISNRCWRILRPPDLVSAPKEGFSVAPNNINGLCHSKVITMILLGSLPDPDS